jgi:hypothetical protein
MDSKTRIATTFRCPSCRRRLVFEDVGGVNAVFFGCPRCECYVIVTNSRVKLYSYGNMFSWKRFMSDLYAAYIEARKYICSY